MNSWKPCVGVAAMCSPLEVGADRAPQAAIDLARLLTAAGCEVTALGVIGTADDAVAAGRKLAEAHADAVAFAPVSWFEDYHVLDLLEACNRPLLLWPLPGMETGALCGTQQLTCYLKQLEKPFAAVFGPIEPGASLDRGLAFLQAAMVCQRLRLARIGLCGARVRGMTEVATNEMALKKVLGPRVVHVDMPTILKRAREADRVEQEKLWRTVKQAAGAVQVREKEGLSAAGMTLAIREVVRQEGLAALAFGCYPDYMGYACLAASILADEGVPIGCEGDVNSTVGMLILQLLTGQPTHNTDWLDPLPDGSVVFTHCGSGSYTLAERRKDITLAPVRLTNQGVCSLFPARPGPVTLIGLLPRAAGYQMAVMEGGALSTDMVFPGNPLRVKFSQPVAQVMDWIFREGIGHHWVAGYGHVGHVLQDLAAIIGPGLRYLSLDSLSLCH